MKKKRTISRIILHIILIIGACIMILLFLWMILTSLKTVSESTSMNPFIFFPETLQWENYLNVIKQNDFIRLYFNTFAMMFFRVLCGVLFSAMAAYAFARLEFPGKKAGFGLVLFQMMVPTQIFIIPQYLMVDKLGLRNTIFALVFPGLVSAFGTFLLRRFLWTSERAGRIRQTGRLQYLADILEGNAAPYKVGSGGAGDLYRSVLV